MPIGIDDLDDDDILSSLDTNDDEEEEEVMSINEEEKMEPVDVVEEDIDFDDMEIDDDYKEESEPVDTIEESDEDDVLNNLDDVITVAKDLSRDEEGFVVRDDNGNRIKVKSPEYLLAAKVQMNGQVTDKRIFEYIKT